MDIDIKLWEKTMQISTLGIFLGVRNSANLMEKSGGGSVVNISSMGALQGSNAYGSAYGFSRGGMINFTKSAAMQLADKNIRVNVVMPGWVHTPFTDYLYNDEIQSEHRVSQVPLKRWGKPDDIAKKISLGKMNKFKEENALLTQAWVMEPKKKVQDIVKELSIADLKIKEFYRIKIGE